MKMYKVQPGHKLTGNHRVFEAGENMPTSELCGDWQGSIKDGAIVEITPDGAPPVKPAAKTPEQTDEPVIIFEQLMAMSPEMLNAEAVKYGVEGIEGFDRRDSLVKALMRKAGYGAIVDEIEARESAGAGDAPPARGNGSRKRRRPPKKDGGK